MTIYYSPSRNAFFDDEIHGPPTLMVVDEDAQAAALDALNARALAIDLSDETEATEDRELKLSELNAIAAERVRQIEEPVLKLVENLHCRLPADARPVEETLYRSLMIAQENGQRIVAGEDGQPVAVDRERSVEEVLAAARAERDRALRETDYTQLPDAMSAAKRKLWAAHRRALRDLPKRIEEAISKGTPAEEAAAIESRNVATTRPA